MTKKRKLIQNKVALLSIISIGILFIIIGIFYSSFSLLEPVEKVIFASEKSNYENKDSGS